MRYTRIWTNERTNEWIELSWVEWMNEWTNIWMKGFKCMDDKPTQNCWVTFFYFNERKRTEKRERKTKARVINQMRQLSVQVSKESIHLDTRFSFIQCPVIEWVRFRFRFTIKFKFKFRSKCLVRVGVNLLAKKRRRSNNSIILVPLIIKNSTNFALS